MLASPSVFVLSRTAPAILSQTVNQGETLVYDASQGVFVNANALGTGPNGSGLINLANTGSGIPLSTIDRNLISLKSLAAGTNVTLTNDGNTITINATSSSPAGVTVYYDVLDHTSGTTNLISLPGDSIILSTEITVIEAFNGTSPSLTIGIAEDMSLLMDMNELDLTEMNNTFKNDVSFVMPDNANHEVQSYLTVSGATSGQFSIFIEYALM